MDVLRLSANIWFPSGGMLVVIDCCNWPSPNVSSQGENVYENLSLSSFEPGLSWQYWPTIVHLTSPLLAVNVAAAAGLVHERSQVWQQII